MRTRRERILRTPESEETVIPFTPTSLPLLAWWDPDATNNIIISGKFSLLADQSGNGTTIQQGVAGLRLIATTGGINGRTVAEGTVGATQYLLTAAPLLTSPTWEIWAVIAYDDYTITDSNEILASYTGGGGMFGFSSSHVRTGRSGVAWDATGTTVLTPDAHVVGWRLESGTYTVFADGSDEGASIQPQTIDLFRLNPAAAPPAGIRFGEIIVTGAALALPERASLLAYLQERWGTP